VPIHRKNSRVKPTRSGPLAWGLDEGPTTPHREKQKASFLRNITQSLGKLALVNTVLNPRVP
jgi:hypothetical protein